MPSRIFTYNPNSPLPGYEQIQDLIIGSIGQNPSNLAPYKWFMGPEENGRYIFAKAVSLRNIPTPDGLNDGNVTFYTSDSNNISFLNTCRYIRKIETGIDSSFSNTSDALEWLNTNGYWTSYTSDLWTPSQITTWVWYDASVSTSFTLVGSEISEWRNLSSTDMYMTQASATKRPLLVNNQLNSLPIVRFDGINDELIATSSITSTISTSLSMYMVVRSRSVPNTGEAPISFSGTSPKNAGIIWQQNIGIDPFIAPKPSFTSWSVLAYVLPYTASNDKIATYTGSTQNGTFQIAGNQNYFLPLATGIRQVGSIFMDCDIAEIVFSQSIHDLTTRQKMEGYLSWKWGLQSGLPLAHPYKNNPPII